MNRAHLAVSALLALLCVTSAVAQTSVRHGEPYRDAALPADARVADLLARMTPREKFRQLFMIPAPGGASLEGFEDGLFGFQFATGTRPASEAGAAGQLLAYDPGLAARDAAERINEAQRWFVEHTRLGIPLLPFDEALHGLVRTGATGFPQAIALAATFDTVRIGAVARAIAAETRSRGIRQILSPVLDLGRDVRWGRVEETYGEDPYLAGEMGVAFIGAFERAGVVASPKHFVANFGEGGRDSYPIEVSERQLREVYLRPYREVIRRAGARSLMASYNSVDGRPSSANRRLLTDWLRSEAGFRGFVISDAGGTGGANVLHFTAADYADATAQALEAGLDVVFQTSNDHFGLFWEAVEKGLVDPAVLDTAVARVLRIKFELGLFENPFVDPEVAARVNGAPEHRALARDVAAASMVLLKNDGGMLPVSPAARRIAVIGRDASDARLGGYSGPGNRVVSMLDGIRARATAASMAVVHARGVAREPIRPVTIPASALRTPSGEPGLEGQYWVGPDFEGPPAVTRRDDRIDFGWTLYSPDPKLPYDWYSARWTGSLVSPVTGRVRLSVEGNDGWRLWLDGRLVAERPTRQTVRATFVEVDLVEGQPVPIRLEYRESVGNARLRLAWDVGVTDSSDADIAAAVEAARAADLAVVVAGIEEGEFQDRSSLALPGRQVEMIRAVAATGVPTVVVLVGGSAITMSDWLADVDAVLLAWYPGEAGGEALADVLFGDVSPGGRLPITFPVSEGQLPLTYGHKPTGRGDDYRDGSGRPLFPFGFGLSYTEFEYSDLRIEPATVDLERMDMVRVTARITNTGERAGDEVVQLYLRDELASVARPVMEMRGFRRVRLEPGESRDVTFDLTREAISMLDTDLREVVEPGRFRIMIGASSFDIRLRGHLEVTPSP